MKKEVIPGLFLATFIAILAFAINQLPFAPFTVADKHPIDGVMIAIIVGLLLNNFFKLPKLIVPGAKFCLKSVLALGIVFMGAKLNFFDVVKLGGVSAGVVMVTISTALLTSFWFGKKLKVNEKLGALIAVGCTICGGSAIAATAPVIEAEDRDISFAVTTITILGVVAMFLYPVISLFIGLTNIGFGFWAGLSIHNTPQVIAAGMMHSPVSGEVATTVKMVRNLFIAPVIILFGYLFRNRRVADKKVKLNYKELFPIFVLGFILMALLRTGLGNFGWIGTIQQPNTLWSIFQIFEKTSMWLITIAMAGIGLATNLTDIKKLGIKGFLVGAATTIIVAIISIVLIFALNLNTL